MDAGGLELSEEVCRVGGLVWSDQEQTARREAEAWSVERGACGAWSAGLRGGVMRDA